MGKNSRSNKPHTNNSPQNGSSRPASAPATSAPASSPPAVASTTDLTRILDTADLTNMTASALLDLLTHAPVGHTIKLTKLDTGALAVEEERKTYASREEYIAQEMPDLLPLQGQAITIAEAEKKYKTSHPTIYRWISSGYIAVLSEPEEYPKRISELDMAYCAQVKAQRQAAGTRTGAPLLDEKGLPYEFKTGMAAYRRKLRREKKGEKKKGEEKGA